MAVQSYSRSAEISPATTLVFPTLRECPPMTTIATLTPSCPAVPAQPTASDTAAPVAPEFPRKRLYRAGFYLVVRRPDRPASRLLRFAHVRRRQPVRPAPHCSQPRRYRITQPVRRSPHSLRCGN